MSEEEPRSRIARMAYWGPFGRMLRNPLTQRVIRNSGYLVTGTTAAAAMSMVQGILAARLLGVSSFGVLGIITVFASVINRLTSFRMGELVISFVGEQEAEDNARLGAAVYKSALVAESISSATAFLIIFLLAPIAARVFAQDPGTTDLFRVYGLMVIGHLVAESSTGMMQHFNRFRALAAIQVGQSALTLILIFGIALAGGGLTAVVLAYLAGKIVGGVGVALAALVQARESWGAGWWRTSIGSIRHRHRAMTRFGLSTNLTGTLTLLTRDSEVLWLGALASPLEAGYYKVALAIINILLIPIQPLISTTFRESAREIATKSWENVRYLLRSGSMMAGAYSVAAAFFLVIFGPWVVSLWGREFLPVAYQALIALLVGAVFINIVYWNRTILLPLGLPEYPTIVTFIGAVLKVVAMLLIVPSMGAVGMGITLSGFFLLTGSLLVIKTLRVLQAREALESAAAPS